MCTAVCYKTSNFYFGRTLDNDMSYGEEVVIVPRRFPLIFRNIPAFGEHYAFVGTACMPSDFPLYYDAVNEKGLCAAGLNFTGNAFYGKIKKGSTNLAQFELLPFLLARCASVREAVTFLKNINVTNQAYNAGMPPAQLHWIIADRREAVVLECTREGMKIYPDPVGVLTNNPPFPMQMSRLNDFMGLSPREPRSTFSPRMRLRSHGRGMGAYGLPGDLSSPSRFVRAAFARENAVSGTGEEESVSQFFHMLDFVSQPRGCCTVGNKYEITLYSSCCNADTGVYYYTTYENRTPVAVDMKRENLAGDKPVRYPFVQAMTIVHAN